MLRQVSPLTFALFCLVMPQTCVGQATTADKLQRRAAGIADAPARHLQAILVGDTNNTELASEKDLAKIKKVITDSFTPQEYGGKIRILDDDDVSEDKLFRAIDGLPAVPRPRTIFVYISSHGRFDKKGRHLLALGNDDVPREEIVAHIRKHRPQLGVLLTDACATKEDLDFQKMIDIKNWKQGRELIERLKNRKTLPTQRETVRRLLLWHRGIVDVNACLPGQDAATDVDRGGFFTDAFALAVCHNQTSMAPPPIRGPNLPSWLRGKVEGRDFNVALQKVDRDGNKFVDWNEFMGTLVNNYLAIFHGAANQCAWIIRLNADDLAEQELPPEIKVYFATASATVHGKDGPQQVGVGRTFFITADKAAARHVTAKQFPNRKDVEWAADVATAQMKMKEVFAKAFPNDRIIEGTLKINIRPKFAKPPPAKIPPPPGRANIFNREYMAWLKKYHPEEHRKLMQKFGDQIRRGRP